MTPASRKMEKQTPPPSPSHSGTGTRRQQTRPGSQGALWPPDPGFARLHPPWGSRGHHLSLQTRVSQDPAGQLPEALNCMSSKWFPVVSCAEKLYPNTRNPGGITVAQGAADARSSPLWARRRLDPPWPPHHLQAGEHPEGGGRGGAAQVQGCWRHLARGPHTRTAWSLSVLLCPETPWNSPCPTWMPTNVL